MLLLLYQNSIIRKAAYIFTLHFPLIYNIMYLQHIYTQKTASNAAMYLTVLIYSWWFIYNSTFSI